MTYIRHVTLPDITSWIHVYTWRTALALDEDGEPVELIVDMAAATRVDAGPGRCRAGLRGAGGGA